MMRENEKSTNRREWLRDCARGGALAGLAGLIVRVTGRRSDPLDALGEPCRKPTLACQTCGLLPQCGVSRAVATRDAGRVVSLPPQRESHSPTNPPQMS